MNTRAIDNRATVGAGARAASLAAAIDRRTRLLLLALIVGYVLLVSVAAIIKLQRYQMGFDLALIQQVIWNTIEGRPFETYAYDFTTNLLGTDSFLVLLVLLPFYLLYPNPASLLVGQTVIVGLSAIPVYLLARDALRQRWAALAIAAIYLVYLPVFNGNLYEVRERVLAMAFELWILLCIHRRWYWRMLIPMALALSCRLDTTFGVALLGLYALLLRRWPEPALDPPGRGPLPWRFGLTLIASALAWYWFVTAVMIPSLTDRPGYLFAEHYAHLGPTPGAIVRAVLLDPLNTLRLVLTPLRGWYLLGMFLPLAFLALLSWRLLVVMLPLYGLNLLSNRQAQWDVYHHYQGQIVPLMLLAAICSLALLVRRRALGRHTLAYGIAAMLAGTVLSHALFGNQVVSLLKRWQPTARDAATNALVARVPADVALAAGNRLAPHVAPRREIFLVPGDEFHYVARPFDKADYALIDLDRADERAEAAAAVATGGWCLAETTRGVASVAEAFARQQADPPSVAETTADVVLLRRCGT